MRFRIFVFVCIVCFAKGDDAELAADAKQDSYPHPKHVSKQETYHHPKHLSKNHGPCIYAFTVPKDSAVNSCSVPGHIEKEVEDVKRRMQVQDHSIREFELFAREIKLQIREYGLDKNNEIRELMHQSVLLLNQTRYERQAARQDAVQRSVEQGYKFQLSLQNLTKIIESLEVWLLELKEENRIQSLTSKSLEFMLQQHAIELTSLKSDMTKLKEEINSLKTSSSLIQKVERLTQAASSLTRLTQPNQSSSRQAATPTMTVPATTSVSRAAQGTISTFPSTSSGNRLMVQSPTSVSNGFVLSSVQGPSPNPSPRLPGDCQEIRDNGQTQDGVFMIRPTTSSNSIEVFCDIDGSYGWTIIQRRQEPGNEDFFRTWEDYKVGFGKVRGEHWLGNDHIYSITSQGSYILKIDLQDWNNRFYSAEYASFRLGDEGDRYELSVGTYKGTAGDSLRSYHDGTPFTTRDRDHDEWGDGNCAERSRGAWWYRSCYASNLNGAYRGNADNKGEYSGNDDGIQWNGIFSNRYSMKGAEMKIRKAN